MMKLTLKGERKIEINYDDFTDETEVVIYDEGEGSTPILKEYGEVMLLLLEDGYKFNTETDRFESSEGYVIKDIIDYCGLPIPEKYVGIVPEKYLAD